MHSIYPMQITLRVTRRVELGHHPAAMVCAIVKRAATLVGLSDGMPVGFLPDAVEVGRMSIHADEPYVFGLQIAGEDPKQCHQRWSRFLDGLNQVGQPKRNQKKSGVSADATQVDERGLNGNFVVAQIQSLVDRDTDDLVAIPDAWFEAMLELARKSSSGLTLRWLSPLCAQLPPRFGKRDGQPNSRAGFFDTDRFPISDLMRRLHRRLTDDFGWKCPLQESDFEKIKLVEPPGLADLHWLKWQYGPKHSVKSLFGVMGRMRIETASQELLRMLVRGQFAGVGEKTTFGLGRYVIEEVQESLPGDVPRFLRARRSKSLVELAVHAPIVEQEAQRLGVSTGHVRSLADRIESPEYQPESVFRFLLP